MAKIGRLGAVNVSGGNQQTVLTVYRVPTGNAAVVTVNINQKGGAVNTFRLYHLEAGTDSPSGEDVILWDMDIEQGSAIQVTGLVLGSQEAVAVRFNSNGGGLMVWGFEEID